MKKITKHYIILALALMLSVGAWAQGHQRYTSAVNVSVLQVGDTLAEGASITYDIGETWSDRNLQVAQNRAKKNGALVTYIYGEGINISSTIGAGGVIINGSDSFTPVTQSGDDGDAWVVTYRDVEEVEENIDIKISGVLLPLPAPTVPALDTLTGHWNFLMPGANKVLKVTYFEQPGLTWLYGTDPMPNAGLTVTRGFHADAIQNISLQVSDTFNTAMRGYFELDQVSASSTWIGNNDNFLAADMANFVDNSSLTEEQVLTFPNPDPGANYVYIIYGFDGSAVKYVLFNGTDVSTASHGLTKSGIYNAINDGRKIFYTTTTVVQGLTLRYGSSNPAVVSFSNPNDMTTFSLNGTGEADIYAVFDGDTTFQYDSVAFHVTVNDPATLTLAQNGNGTVEAETASTDTWNSSTWISWASGADATHTVDGVTISSVNASVYNYGGSTNPLRLAAWSSTGNSITFVSDGGNFTRIEMTLVDGNTIRPSDGWTISGNSAVWEGNTDTLIITNCTLKVSQIVFHRENPTIASTDVDGQYIVIPGAEVKVVATAQDGNYLSEWSNGAAVANRISDTLALTVNETMTLSASFAQNPTLTLASEGNGTVALQRIGKDSTLYSNALNTQALYNDMTVVDNNGTSSPGWGEWVFKTVTGGHAEYVGSSSKDGDDWLVTPSIQMEAGHTYKVRFQASCSNGNFTERFEVKAAPCTTATAVCLSDGIKVIDTTSYRSQNYRNYSGTFTVPSDGDYLVGIHAISIKDGAGLKVKNLYVEEFSTLPADITATENANTFRVLPGTELTVNATPAANHYVASWSNDAAVDSILGAKQTFTMPAENTTLSASFAQNPTLTLASNNGGEFEVVLPSSESKIITASAPASGTRSNDTVQVTLEGQLEYSSTNGWQALYQDQSQGSITVTAANGFTIESCKFNFRDGSYTVTEAPFTLYTYCDGSNQTIRDQPNGQGNSLASGVVSIEVSYKAVPNVIAAATPNTYYVDYGTPVTVIATPDSVHYLAGFQGYDDTNSNVAVEMTFDSVIADLPLTATFAPKPVLTLTANDTTWGNLSVELVMGTASTANEVQIGDGTETTELFPIDNCFNYSCTEQIYTADEIGTSGTIYSISFYYNYGTPYTASNVTLYMKNVSRSVFSGNTDCEPLSVNDIVWTGNIAPTEAGWYTFTLDTPFEYNGTDNLMVAFYDGTSGYAGTSYDWRQTSSPNSAKMALRYYSDNNNPDPYNLSGYNGSKQLYNYRSNIKLGIATLGLPAGVAQLTDTTYRVDYGTEVTLEAKASELRHVANWVDADSVAYPADNIAYFNYFTTQPVSLFPDSSTLTFTVTADTMAKAIFGINYRNLVFSHNEGGHMEFVVNYDSIAFSGISTTSVTGGDITITADQADEDGMYLRNETSNINIAIEGGASITQVDFHITNGANLVGTISTDYEGATITSTDNNEYATIKNLNTPNLTISSSTTHDLQIDQFIVHYGNALPSGVAVGPNDSTWYVMPDTTVKVRAIPDEGHYLISWVSAPDSIRILDTLTVEMTVTTDDTLKAVFAPNPVITLAVNDENGGSVYFTGYQGNTITRGGIIKAQSVDLPYQWYEAGEIMSIEGGNGMVTKDEATSHYLTVNGVFDGTATVVTSAGAFSITSYPTLPNGVRYNIADDNYTINPYTELSFTATPNPNYYFVDWAKVTATDSTIFDSVAVTTVRIDKDMKLQGNFLHNPYVLTLVADANMGTLDTVPGQGYVTRNDNGTYTVMTDSTVTLVAAANTGYHITGWQNAQGNQANLTNDTVRITMTGDTTITVNLAGNPVVTLAANGNGTMTVDSLPDYAVDNQNGTYSVLPGTVLSFTSTPDTHYYMTRWNDSDSMINSNVAVTRTDTINADTTIGATFAHKPILTLTVNDTNSGSVTLEGAGSGSGSGEPVDVTIGDGTATSYYGPFNSLWGYSFVESLYTAEEIGTAGTITSISYNMQSTDPQTNNFVIYMKNVSRSTFASGTDFEPVTEADIVYSGSFTFNNGWSTITLDTPFEYDGTSNLMIAFDENTDSYSTRYFYYTSSPNRLISVHSDSNNPNPLDMSSYSGSTYTQNHSFNIKLDITPSTGMPAGVAQLTDTTYVVDYNNDVIMKANAKTGYNFLRWEGANGQVYGTDSVLTISPMVTDTLVHAVFDTLHYNLVVNIAEGDEDFGSVEGSVSEARHFEEYTIEATADSGYHFVVWSDGDSNAARTVTLTSDSTFTATFDTNTYNLNVVVADACTGFGTVEGDTIAKHFKSYAISAEANPGYHFVAWSDGDSNATRTVELTSDSTIEAIFDYNPSLTLVYRENSGDMKFVVESQTETFTGISTNELSAGGISVNATSADATYGISVKSPNTLTIVAAGDNVIQQVAFHLTNGTNRAETITANHGTLNATNGTAIGTITGINSDSVTISSTSTKDINIDQLTIQYAPVLPAGVVHIDGDEDTVYRLVPGTVVQVMAIPFEGNYLLSWDGDTTSTDDLIATVTMADSDLVVTANFSGDPVMTLTSNGEGRIYFESYAGYTINRDETILMTNYVFNGENPYTWYEAGEIYEINDPTGMVTYDTATKHYISVHGQFTGIATVVTTSGSFAVTCIPTVPNGVTVMREGMYIIQPGTEVTVVAEPAEEHYLYSWDDITTTENVRDITVTRDTNIVVNFLHNPYTLAVNVDTVMGSAAPAEGQTHVTLNADGTYTVMADSTVTLVATADSGYHFVNWMEADSVYSTAADTTVLANADRTFSANIDTNVYQLIVLAADSAMGAVAGTDSTAKHFLSHDISATPNAGFRFVSWSDGDTNASRAISLTQDSTLTATFDTIHAELAWSAESFTGYTLIDFNSYKPTLSNPNNVEVRYGVVESGLTIDAADGTVGVPVAYGNIASDTGVYTIYAVHDLTNEFFYDSVAYTLTVERGVVVNISKNNSEGGSALFADRDSLPTLTHHYASGIMAFVAHDAAVNVVAEAAEGFHFTAWQEGNLDDGYSDIAATAEYTYTVPDTLAAGLKAVFDTNVYNMNIAVADANDGMGTVTGPATVKHFLSGAFVATAETGYHFTGWVNEADSVVSMSDTLVVAPVSDTTLYATFDTNVYTLTVLASDSAMGSVAGSRTVKHFVECEISATPANSCHEFVAWSDGDSNAVRTVTLTGDSTITAEFAYTLRESIDTAVVCDTMIWNDSTYLVSGDYEKLLQTAEHCDTIAKLHLTVKYSTESMTTVTECESYKWHDITYTMSTLAHFDTVNAAGCDSIANLDLTIHHNTVGEETVVTCDTMYFWNGITYTSSTIGTWSGTNQYGCDSTATLNLTLNHNFTGYDVQEACVSYTWIDGNTYTTSQLDSTVTYTYAGGAANGCDSTVILLLTINQPVSTTETVTACDSYTWHGATYTASTDSPSYTTTAANGCDSTVTLDLTVNNSVTSQFAAQTCSYYIWNGTYYDSTGTYTRTYSAANSCDSVVTMTLTVNSTVTSSFDTTACGSYTWNDVEYAASGAYSHTYRSVHGCDSVVTMRLSIKQPVTKTLTATGCNSYFWNGELRTESGEYRVTNIGANSCDSVTILQLTILTTGTSTDNVTACDSVTWINGVTYYETPAVAPTYTVATDNCSTLVTLNLTINKSVTSQFDMAACNSHVWDGTYYNQSGSYNKSYRGANSCDSTVTMNLTINQPTTDTVSATGCDSYEWNGVTYIANGSYSYTMTGSNGCDSTTTLQLTLNQSGTTSETVTACDEYLWNGELRTVSGEYRDTTTGTNGCTMVNILNLTIKNSAEATENVTACDSYMWNGELRTENGEYRFTTTGSNGCDSTTYLNLTVNHGTSSQTDVTACDSYSWNGMNYTVSGTYTFDTVNSLGCDSTATLNLTVNYRTAATEIVTACDSYFWNGELRTESGEYRVTNTGANGCDSTTTLQLTIATTGTSTDNITACDSLTWIDGVTYYETPAEAPTYTVTGETCNTIVTLNLTINNSVESSFDTAACVYHIWDGAYYNQSGSYTKHYNGVNGCDSAVTMTLTVNRPVTSSFSDTACVSYTWNNVEYILSGAYSQTFSNANGCDSTVTLLLTVKQPKTVTVSQTACDSYTWNGQTYNASGNYSYTTTGSNGCDSTTVLQLTVNQTTTASETVMACDSYSWHGQTYTESGSYSYTTIGANGCNLVTTLNLTVNSSVAGSVTATACNYYIWDGNYYNQSGSYTKSYTAANGCDSVVTMALTVNQPVTATDTVTACDSYTWNGQTYTVSGSYSHTTTGSNGCDSTTVLQLTVNQSATATETVSACGSYTWIDGVTYTASTNTPTFTTIGANGCNLVTTLHLTINNPVHTAETMAACESYTWNGTAYTASGDYTYSHNDANGCVQVDTLHLTVNNPVHTAETMVACGSYIWHGTTYVVSGDYTFSHADANGCTQVDTLHLTVGNSVVVDETVTTCDSYEWNGRVYTENGEYTYSTTTVNGCDSTVILHLTVNHSATSTFDTLAYGSFTWNGQTYTESGAYEQTLTTVNGCDSVVTLNLVILPEGFVMPYLYNLMDVMLSVNHNEDGAENVHYIWYRWYRNGELVLEGPNYDSYSENGNRLSGCYYLEVAVDESMQYWVRSNEVCINGVGIEDVENVEITLAPNPVRQGSMVKVSADGADLQGAELRVFDLQGRMVLEQKDNAVFMAPSATGMYMVRLTLSDGRKVVSKLIVK